MVRDKAEKQKQRAKEMLGISDNRAKEIFEEQPDRKQQKKQELEKKGKLDTDKQQADSQADSEPETRAGTEDEEEEVELHACPECGDEFDSSRGMKVHKSQKH